MTTKIKGIRKGFKFISQIFVVKEEREMEIGYPTDVKHVAHIGWDNQSGSAPAWMNDFKCSSDFSTASLGSIGGETDPGFAPVSSWCSQDFDQSIARQPSSEIFNDAAPKDIPKAPKKHKRKKMKSSSSPKSTSSSLRGSRVPKASSSSTITNMEINPNDLTQSPRVNTLL